MTISIYDKESKTYRTMDDAWISALINDSDPDGNLEGFWRVKHEAACNEGRDFPDGTLYGLVNEGLYVFKGGDFAEWAARVEAGKVLPDGLHYVSEGDVGLTHPWFVQKNLLTGEAI